MGLFVAQVVFIITVERDRERRGRLGQELNPQLLQEDDILCIRAAAQATELSGGLFAFCLGVCVYLSHLLQQRL